MEGRPRHDGIGDAHGASIANDEMEGTNSMPLRTKLTEKLGISHPVLLAPMGTASGGTLAKAVTEAGGFGIIGFGYGNQERIDQEFRAAGNARVGCGFITWSLARQPHLLARALDHKPAAVMLSFGDARPFVALEKSLPTEAPRYARAAEGNDLDTSVVFTGECVDLIRNVKPAAAIVASIVHEAETALRSNLPLRGKRISAPFVPALHPKRR